MLRLFVFPFFLFLTQCAFLPEPTPTVARTSSQTHEIINVSAYDPKERQREGQGYSENNLIALRNNGAKGLIARAGKGGVLDTKCSQFIASADRAGLLAGIYYRVQRHVSVTQQADQFVNRAIALNRNRPQGVAPLLLCGDYDGDLTLETILAFMDRVEARTGVVPVAYLENSQDLKLRTRAADPRTKARLLRAPYWLALYSHESGQTSLFPPPVTPGGLVKQYNLWPDWTLWQYGGVKWENRRSQAQVYSHGGDRFPRYFGNLDRPLERNIFRGSTQDLLAFWSRHGLAR